MNFNLRCSVVVGPSQVNSCLLIKKGKDFVVKGLGFYEVENPENEDEVESIVDAIARELPSDIFTSMSFKHDSIIQHIYFYQGNIVNLRAVIYRDLKRDYEIELKDYLIDYEDYGFTDKRVVFVVAFPKRLFDIYRKALKKYKKMRLFSLETHTISIKRLVNIFSKDELVLCCNAFDDYSNIFALNKGKILLSRDLRYSLKDVVKELSETSGIDTEKAEELIYEQGLYLDEAADDMQKAVYDIISKSFDQFGMEIQRTIDYLMSIQKVKQIDKVVIVGKLSNIKRADSYMSRLFSLRVEKIEAQKLFEFDSGIEFSFIKNMNYFSVCIGAALRRLE